MRRACVLAAILVAGCGGGGPASGRLAAGSRAIAVSGDGQSVGVSVAKARMYALQAGGINLDLIDPGTEVAVDGDDAPPEVLVGEDHRPVRVTVMEGENKGSVGTVPRFKLRPK